MLCQALDDVGFKPDGQLKEGYAASTGVMTSDNLKLGLLMLLQQAAALHMFVFRTHLFKLVGVKNVQYASDLGQLTFCVESHGKELQVTVVEQAHSLMVADSHDSSLTGEAFKITLSRALPEEEDSQGQT